jgi:large subunit ribosomal protein L25
MADKVLHVEARGGKGSAESRRSRAEGLIPAVVYGHSEPKHILVNRREFKTVFKHITESEIITLKLGKEEVQVLVKDYQSDIVRGELMHLDFFEIEKGKSLKTRVPLHVHGTPIGVREGGILEAPLHELDIECLPKDLPSSIEVDISNLGATSAIHVRELEVPEGVHVLTNGDQVVAAVTHAKAEVTEEAEEGEEGAAEAEEEESEE